VLHVSSPKYQGYVKCYVSLVCISIVTFLCVMVVSGCAILFFSLSYSSLRLRVNCACFSCSYLSVVVIYYNEHNTNTLLDTSQILLDTKRTYYWIHWRRESNRTNGSQEGGMESIDHIAQDWTVPSIG